MKSAAAQKGMFGSEQGRRMETFALLMAARQAETPGRRLW